MALSRKHFCDLADTLKDQRRHNLKNISDEQYSKLVAAMAAFCRSHNSAFDAGRFANACKVS